MRWIVIVVMGALAGCGSSPPSCKDAVAKAGATSGADAEMIRLLTAACETAGWTAEQRSCLAAATDRDSVAQCLLKVELPAAAAKADEARQ